MPKTKQKNGANNLRQIAATDRPKSLDWVMFAACRSANIKVTVAGKPEKCKFWCRAPSTACSWMAEGEACGVAAAPGAKNNRTPHQIARFAPDYGPDQAALRADGADIGDGLR